MAPRVTFTRNLGNIVMDIGTTEKLRSTASAATIRSRWARPRGLIAVTIDGGAGADTFNACLEPVNLIGGTEQRHAELRRREPAGQRQPRVDSRRRRDARDLTHGRDGQRPNAPSGARRPSRSPRRRPIRRRPRRRRVITLAGTAADAGGIQSVTWANDRGGSGAAAGTTNWTAPDIPLQSGVNVITVTAQDASGNSASDTLTVTVDAFTYLLAEGATGTFFDLDVLIANPNNAPAPVAITFLKEDGTTVTQNLTVAPTSRATIAGRQIAGLEAAGGVSTRRPRPTRCRSSSSGRCSGTTRTTARTAERRSDGPARAGCSPKARRASSARSCCSPTRVRRANTVTVTFLREGEHAGDADVRAGADVAPHDLRGRIPELRRTRRSGIVGRRRRRRSSRSARCTSGRRACSKAATNRRA